MASSAPLVHPERMRAIISIALVILAVAVAVAAVLFGSWLGGMKR